MLRNNILLQEAVERTTFDPAPIISDFKKLMNTCKLTKFRSDGECSRLFSGFFMNNVEASEPLTFEQWCVLYTTLLNDTGFCANMCLFMAIWQPSSYMGMFRPLTNLIDSELSQMTKNQIRYLSDAKAFMQFMQMKFNSIGETIKSQTNDQNAIKFIVTVDGVINTNVFYINNLIQRCIDNGYDKDAIEHVMTIHEPLAEDVQEILDLLENYDNWVSKYCAGPMNEAIVNKVKEAAKVAQVKSEKASRAFDEFVMKRVKKARENRRNRKHAEMVGEALRINREVKRLLGSLAVGAISPAVGVILWVGSVVVDRQTDKRDRDILIGQIKDELEIIEEKISQAERNGDDKAKVELIRLRQKLQHEYERINRFRFDPQRLHKS